MQKIYININNRYLQNDSDVDAPASVNLTTIAGIKTKGKFSFGLLYATPIFFKKTKNSLYKSVLFRKIPFTIYYPKFFLAKDLNFYIFNI